ncbi:helix-turn-helix transcriptional regulator [Chromobacterium haemolyticum]|uniref:Helix-turn-helix transcriptional regulator n=1 Tax=Chromobacterium haemolyticum TaxID=394935 RepID=A0ABS3GNF0_9NEIS|nr:helix-turn-helix transcriptional regulator [Chromobacterium haemolyticum]MBK0415221.1 helix-turn-helix transcriptional regulator [Chromobacterium haemolyticum]MBO0416564.1 helix-turn-helix transcriptional regulator [Chromobacterium haemolyticum]MBO0499860.1 helix-turn-helix transcriptional regulator [Chromobacterium haemolyticum]
MMAVQSMAHSNLSKKMYPLKHIRVAYYNTNVMPEPDTIVFMNTYGDRVRARRAELGLSQSELAKMIGAKNQSTIGNIENRNGSSRYTLELSKALRVRYEWLETGQGEKELPGGDAPLMLRDASLADILEEVERRGAGDSARLIAELVLKNKTGG